MTVLDLGGDTRAWRSAPIRPRRLILWNLSPQESGDGIECAVKDVCEVDQLPDVDLVYSNSVIEHVGGHWRRERFAEAVRRADCYWVQTPNRYFPIEPHFLIPWGQHLPLAIRHRLVEYWPIGFGISDSREDALRDTLSTELLSLTELRYLFPGAEIYRERFLGLTKSFVAIQR